VDRLFIAIHVSQFDENGQVRIGAFAKEELSTDWEKYSTAEQSQARRRVPGDNAIGALVAGAVRQIEGQEVVHDPDPIGDPHREPPLEPNRAHALIRGRKSTKERVLLRDRCTIVIACDLRPRR